LIGNALKFRHPDRPPLVHIGAVAKGDQWEVTVADNGIGVQPEFKDRIFAIFQRLHSRERYPGTGMGLTICKRIVEKHGGAMWVEPAPVGGAAFHLTLHNAANSDTSR
jgi:light-regulated signal transduction histidine kinase (bacteriophytochrome)